MKQTLRMAAAVVGDAAAAIVEDAAAIVVGDAAAITGRLEF